MILYITAFLYLALGILILLLGIVILKENFTLRINRITGLMMFFAGCGPVFGGFGLLLEAAPMAPADLDFLQRFSLLWEFFFPQLLLFSFVFPRENKWIQKHPWFGLVIFLPHIFHYLIVLSFPNAGDIFTVPFFRDISDQLGIFMPSAIMAVQLIQSLIGILIQIQPGLFALVNLIYFIGAIAFMLMGYRSLQGTHLKKQVGLVIWGIRVSVGLYAIAFIFPRLNLIHTSRIVAHLLTTTALFIGIGSIGWAIIRYQFMDIRLFIRRGLIFSFTSVLVIGLYLVFYSQGKQWMRSIFGFEIPVFEMVFLLIALLFFQPLFHIFERLTENLLLRDSRDFRNVLMGLSHDIMTTIDISKLHEKMISTLKEVLGLNYAGMMIRADSGEYCCEREGKRLCFSPDTQWITRLKEKKGALGYDELVRQVTGEEDLEDLRRLDAYLLVPMRHRDTLVGILCLGKKVTRARYTTEDMTLLSVLSDQAAIALENARLYQETLEKQRMEEELKVARDIQQNLLPKDTFHDPDFELSGFNLPSKEVGGDYYDYITLENGTIGIAIGDISGKGIPAAILMSNLQAALRVSARGFSSSRRVMAQVNRQIVETTSPEKFATFFYGVYHPKRGWFEYTNAGHNFPVVRHKNGDLTLLKKGGLVIGVKKDFEYHSEKLRLKSGDTMLFYTDGVTEAMNSSGEEFGEDRLFTALLNEKTVSPKELIEGILTHVSAFTGGCMQNDDLTMVVLQVY